MPLPAGTRLGQYEIRGALGAGGMGEVYRARDTTLGRDVAIKILPESLRADPERLARLEREARALAALNHPNIGAIYNLEEHDGVRTLVLELVDGVTLANRLRAPLPIAEAIAVARQIADALDAAHERGIVHRDLKPANVMITPTGVVKVLDFGLAKNIGPATGADASGASSMVTGLATREGLVVGTPSYMSPEQARGLAVDKRSDVWAFGCVLFQMLTGRPAFAGATATDVLASVIERAPDWSLLPALTPTSVTRVLRGCLEKDQARRWRDIGDVRRLLDEPAAEPTAGTTVRGGLGSRERIAWGGAATLLAGAALAALLLPGGGPLPTAAPEIRFDASLPAGMESTFAQLAISPSGDQLAVAPVFEGVAPLWLRPIGSVEGRILPGTGGALLPFWSPDGRSIGFFAARKLRRIDLDSQVVTDLADVRIPRGGAWTTDGAIIYAPHVGGPLMRVPATGGQAVTLTTLAEGQTDHRTPVVLPSGRHLLYYARGTPQARGAYVANIDGTAPLKLLESDAAPVVFARGHVLFVRNGDLLAQPFDAEQLKLTGDAFRVGGPVAVNTGVSIAALTATARGEIAYSSAGVQHTQFVRVDRTGRQLESLGTPDNLPVANPSLSPDGRTVAFSRIVQGNWDVWTVDGRGALARITTEPSLDFLPLWTPDGRRIVFQSTRGTTGDLFVRNADGSGEEIVLRSSRTKVPTDIAADGSRLLFTTNEAGNPADIWLVPLTGDRTPRAVVESPFDDRDAQFSPDSRWIAYQSNETGQIEVYVRPLDRPAPRLQVSTGGGQQVRWARNGELFYIASDRQLMAVTLRLSPDREPAVTRAVPLFLTAFDAMATRQTRPQYLAAADAKQFVLNQPSGTATPPVISVVLGWRGVP